MDRRYLLTLLICLMAVLVFAGTQWYRTASNDAEAGLPQTTAGAVTSTQSGASGTNTTADNALSVDGQPITIISSPGPFSFPPQTANPD